MKDRDLAKRVIYNNFFQTTLGFKYFDNKDVVRYEQFLSREVSRNGQLRTRLLTIARDDLEQEACVNTQLIAGAIEHNPECFFALVGIDPYGSMQKGIADDGRLDDESMLDLVAEMDKNLCLKTKIGLLSGYEPNYFLEKHCK